MSDTKNGIANLFTIRKDDSPLKTAVVYGGAGLGIYYVLKLLRWDVNRTQAAQAQEQEVAKANTTVDSAASLAAKLGAAISSWGNTDERVIYDILWDKVASREFLQEIYKSYSVQFGRSLETDLYENLDNFLQPWKPDWSIVKKRIEYIKLVQRKIVNGTPQYVKLANPMPVNPKKP